MSLAKVLITGVLIGEPEKRFTPNNTAVTNFTIQVTPQNTKDAPFTVRVTCWRGLADVVASQLQKGHEITVEGRLQINQFESASGVVRRMYEIDALNVYHGSLQSLAPFEMQGGTGRPQQASSAPPQGGAYAPPPVDYVHPQGSQATAVASPPASFPQSDLLTDDDIPF